MLTRLVVVAALILSVFCAEAQGLMKGDSPNVTALMEKLPFVAGQPIAREIRYIYSSVSELNGKMGDPFYVTNEDENYKRQPTPGTSWDEIPNDQLDAFSRSGRDWIKENEASWSATEMEGYMAFQQSMDRSMSALHTYFSVMSSLSALAYGWAEKDAGRLTTWTANTTKCIGDAAPQGSILHLEIMHVITGEKFKFHSANDFIVIATLESNGKMISSTRAMQMWINTKKKRVSPANMVPMYHENASQEVLEILKPVTKNGFLPRHAMLINAAVEDIYNRLIVLGEISD